MTQDPQVQAQPAESNPKRGRGRPPSTQSLQPKLAEAEAKAEKIRAQIREQAKKERQATANAVAAMVQRDDALADFSPEVWRAALPQIREVLAAQRGA